MGREIRRVPVDYEPPRDPCRYVHSPRLQREPCPGWHHRPQYDESHREAVEKWRRGKAQWEAGEHEDLAFESVYHRRGGGAWNGRHIDGTPKRIYARDGETLLREVWFEDVDQWVRDVPWEDGPGYGPEPEDNGYYHPDWPEGTPMGYCFYETVGEGTPLSPVFATTDDLAQWLVEHEGMSPEGAARFVGIGWAPSGIAFPTAGFMTGMQAVDAGL
jgi:hypothetical protein